MANKKRKARGTKVTSPRVAGIAARQLKSANATKRAKSTAGSALSQKE